MSRHNVRPLEWHQECLANQKANLKRVEAELDGHMKRVEQLRIDMHDYESVIKSQIAKGVTEFDRERIAKKLKKQGKL